MGVGQGREQAIPAHPALTAFAHPYTAEAEALQQKLYAPDVATKTTNKNPAHLGTLISASSLKDVNIATERDIAKN